MPNTTAKILSSLKTISLYTTAGAATGFAAGLGGGSIVGGIRDMMIAQGVERQIDDAFKAAHNGLVYEVAVAQNPENSQALGKEIMHYQNFYYDREAAQFNTTVYLTTAIFTLTGGIFGFYTGIKKALDCNAAKIQNTQELKGLNLV